VLDVEEEEELPWLTGMTGPVPDYTAVYRWNTALHIALARLPKDREILHNGVRTWHAEYSCWDSERGCRWTVLVNQPEHGEWVEMPAITGSLFDNETPAATRPLVTKPILDWIVIAHPAPSRPNHVLQALSTAGKPVPLLPTLLRKLALELDSSPPHETH
jgi:hypothetical protein